MAVGELESCVCDNTTVFFTLMTSENLVQAVESWFIILLRVDSFWGTIAASSAKRRSLTFDVVVFVDALNLERLNKDLSVLHFRYTSPGDVLKAFSSMTAKYMLKRVGARTQPCFIPLLISKESQVDPSNCTVAFMLLWNEMIS